MTRDAEQQKYSEIAALVSVTVGREQFRNAKPRFYTAWVKSGNWNAVQVLQDTHIFRSAGFELLEHLHFDQIVPQLSHAIAEQHMARVRSCAHQHFAAS